jgi:carboxyl-terminal processing protease
MFSFAERIQLRFVEVVPIIIMRHSKIKTCMLVALLSVVVATGCLTAKKNPPQAVAIPVSSGLSPGPNDGRIAFWTARLMEHYHYLQEPLNTDLSGKFFDGYLETLDPRRENFLQSDIDEFAHWRTNLDTLTIGRQDTSDLTPAFQIFRRFLERLQQHETYVEELLKEGKFKFTDDDRILIDRRHAPYPGDLAAAQQLWRERLRYDYLQEKLSRELSATNDNSVVPLPRSAAADIADTLVRHYRWNYQMATNWDSTDVLQAYLEAFAHAYDPHSDYQNYEQAQDFSISMSLSLFGIGAQLREDDGYCKIDSLVHGGPAEKSKQLNSGDYIVAVAQSNSPPVDVVDMGLGKVVQLIRGEKGTEVRLTISPEGDRAARRVVTMIRDEIKLEDSEAKARLIEVPDGQGGTNRIGVIDVPSFYTPIDLPGNAGHSKQSYVSDDVAKLIKKLKQEKVVGIIIDLRTNPGGSLEEAVKFTGLFVKAGPVVLARRPDGRVLEDANNDSSVLYDGPLAVMINRLSASASEIVAAALQDYGRALIIGDTSTFGKGTVQSLYPLYPWISLGSSSTTNDPGTIKITIHKFYRITGASTQFKGVESDIVLPDKLNYSPDIGETALENPLPWDTIPGADYDKLNLDYTKLNLIDPYLATLRLRSEARTATNQDFVQIRQDIEEFQKQLADKTATLNEREAIKEREDHQALLNVHERERLARPVPEMKAYDITVENAGQPLQAAGAETNSISGTDQKDPAKNIGNDVIEYQAAENARLAEAETILEDYISLLATTRTLLAK